MKEILLLAYYWSRYKWTRVGSIGHANLFLFCFWNCEMLKGVRICRIFVQNPTRFQLDPVYWGNQMSWNPPMKEICPLQGTLAPQFKSYLGCSVENGRYISFHLTWILGHAQIIFMQIKCRTKFLLDIVYFLGKQSKHIMQVTKIHYLL